MKKIVKVLAIASVLAFAIASCAFAGEKYLMTKKYTYQNKGSRAINGAYIDILIGQKNLVDYEKDDYIKINPEPNKTFTDEYGNLYAHYDVSTYNPGREITITIEKVYETSDVSGDIAVRSQSTQNLKNEFYVLPQERIESEEADIISKAKEITFGLSSDYKRAKAIFEYVNTNMKYNTSSNYANKGALSALTSLNGVCEEYATLFAALCRALEKPIPVRLITGYRVERELDQEERYENDFYTGEEIYHPETYNYSLVAHVWNEIWFDDYGWLPVDTCSFLVDKDGKKKANYNSFCKIKGDDYIAEGIYKGDNIYVVYNENFEQTESEEYVELYQKVEEKEHKFLDLENYDWAKESIETLYKMNVIKGYTEEEYGPANNVTRNEFVTLLARVLKNLNYEPGTYKNIYYYLDYDKSSYSKREYDFLMRCLEDAYPADSFAAGFQAIQGIFGSSFNMNKPITRGEVVALMEPFMQKRADHMAYNFPDSYSSKFYNAIVKSATNGLIKGYEDGTFRADNNITRAEIAVIFDRYVGVKDFII